MKLIKKILLDYKITLLTGLHIGGTNSAIGIGGPDSFVIRNPVTGLPYIPGSSLKGKMRALVEIKDGSAENGKPCTDPTKDAGLLFGTSAGSKGGQPSRIIVRDAMIDHREAQKWVDLTDLHYTESKTEVSIDRITGTSSNSGPRTIERVPAGAIFNASMVVNVMEGEDENKLLKTLDRALKLLQDDYLGGNGSRGYGQVLIEQISKEEKNYNE